MMKVLPSRVLCSKCCSKPLTVKFSKNRTVSVPLSNSSSSFTACKLLFFLLLMATLFDSSFPARKGAVVYMSTSCNRDSNQCCTEKFSVFPTNYYQASVCTLTYINYYGRLCQVSSRHAGLRDLVQRAAIGSSSDRLDRAGLLSTPRIGSRHIWGNLFPMTKRTKVRDISPENRVAISLY